MHSRVQSPMQTSMAMNNRCFMPKSYTSHREKNTRFTICFAWMWLKEKRRSLAPYRSRSLIWRDLESLGSNRSRGRDQWDCEPLPFQRLSYIHFPDTPWDWHRTAAPLTPGTTPDRQSYGSPMECLGLSFCLGLTPENIGCPRLGAGDL